MALLSGMKRVTARLGSVRLPSQPERAAKERNRSTSPAALQGAGGQVGARTPSGAQFCCARAAAQNPTWLESGPRYAFGSRGTGGHALGCSHVRMRMALSALSVLSALGCLGSIWLRLKRSAGRGYLCITCACASPAHSPHIVEDISLAGPPAHWGPRAVGNGGRRGRRRHPAPLDHGPLLVVNGLYLAGRHEVACMGSGVST